jgi:hypothetical protein
MMQSWFRWTIAALACALIAPAAAAAATVSNGDFETGNLNGWQTTSSSSGGGWFTYTEEELGPEFPPPPSGRWAAATEEFAESTMILYQDVALEPGLLHQLSLTLYYRSAAPISVPEPNTLDSQGSVDSNQQLRVDVIKPSAPIETLDPADILSTVFANKNGDPQFMAPTKLTADLTPFAGQTVRLRIANAVEDSYFNAGVDAVSITSTSPPPPPPPPPSNAITRGELTLNKKNGTGKLAVNVPGPGTLTEVGKGKKKKVKAATLATTAAGTAQVPLKPTALGRKVLKTKGKLKTGIEVTFTPTGGAAGIQSYKVILKKTLKP